MSKKKFVEKNKNDYQIQALSKFYDECSCNKRNPNGELSLITRWIRKFSRDTLSISPDSLVEMLNKRLMRIKSLTDIGKSGSIIDLSLYEIYSNSEEEALKMWNDLRLSKSQKVKKFSRENIELFSGVNYALSLDAFRICNEKYGEIEGLKIFLERQKKWKNTLNSKSDAERLIINLKKNGFSIEGVMLRGYTELQAQRMVEERLINAGKYYSDESIKFFKENFNSDGWLFGDEEWFIYDQEMKRHFFYDFTNREHNIIFEYHSEIFHPNFRLMSEEQINSWKCPLSNENGIDVRNRDQCKKLVAERAGFKLFEIFSNDDQAVKNSIIHEIKGIISE